MVITRLTMAVMNPFFKIKLILTQERQCKRGYLSSRQIEHSLQVSW